MPLDSALWGSWDVGMYPDERYNMTLWLFKTDWFEGKSKADVVRDLPERGVTQITGDTVSYEVRYSDEFMERWNIDYVPREVGLLTLWFENDTVAGARYQERKHVESLWVVKKSWATGSGKSR